MSYLKINLTFNLSWISEGFMWNPQQIQYQVIHNPNESKTLEDRA